MFRESPKTITVHTAYLKDEQWGHEASPIVPYVIYRKISFLFYFSCLAPLMLLLATVL